MGAEDEEGQGFQETQGVIACIDRGASTLTSHGEVKRLSRSVCTAQPSVDEQRPLNWSHVPITFNAANHPNRTTVVGVLPLVVSPVIHTGSC